MPVSSNHVLGVVVDTDSTSATWITPYPHINTSFSQTSITDTSNAISPLKSFKRPQRRGSTDGQETGNGSERIFNLIKVAIRLKCLRL
jgi:hypothetical protein